ncbi:MAG: energy-coupling factor transporter transmembrane component T [[Clostridium] leptum]
MRNPISEFHPLAVFLYFMTAVGITLLWNRPGLLLASFLIAFGYACALEKGKNILRSLVWLLLVTALPVIVNPLVNHRGNTPVLYINDQPITLEAVLYGLFTGLMIAAMLFWFQAYSKSLDSDGFLYLFGGKLPSIALMVTMIFRFVPSFTEAFRRSKRCRKLWEPPSAGGR